MLDLVISVQLLLQRLNPSKASGPDYIANRLLKEAAHEIAPILTAIFQQSYEHGELPADWKEARVTPVFKKGDRNASENYRPVSLTCVSCKLMEHVVSRHIMDHLDRYKILSAYQHGFRKLHSSASQFLMTTHDFLSFFDRKVQVDVAVLDFSKAFDTVTHLRLMKKLHQYGIRDTSLTWIKEFLSDRTQQVVIDEVSSDKVKVESGVPQGTVLGPLLFLLHINDLPDAVVSQVRLFADDCLIYREIRSIADQIELQRDLERLHDWALTWGMRFNTKKCNILRIHRRAGTPLSFFYELDKHILEEVTTTKYLGLNFSFNLKWDDHISAICAKANSTLGFLRRNLKFAPKTLKKVAYKSLVRSKLEFASIVWDPFLVKNIDVGKSSEKGSQVRM
ncbi:PREDICTED: RNA-directed DNA polymerase from mobile element jockey-like [Priapulus caudatus]|uniref:RNA-directed DNA polymerase from mobile element jockey-like n=1 Tax=Priapulus caudatus TaxID=37621 RepID=A0ABM1DTW0_PRICU|nr:PREDICTED: RNA-directed DNA polymerase from mobile element jockey-like [Priapulus caudatus]